MTAYSEYLTRSFQEEESRKTRDIISELENDVIDAPLSDDDDDDDVTDDVIIDDRTFAIEMGKISLGLFEKFDFEKRLESGYDVTEPIGFANLSLRKRRVVTEEKRNDKGETALHQAVIRGDLLEVETLIAFVNKSITCSQPPLLIWSICRDIM